MWDYVCMRMHGAYNAHMNYIHVRSALNITQHRQSRELTLDNINEKKKRKRMYLRAYFFFFFSVILQEVHAGYIANV